MSLYTSSTKTFFTLKGDFVQEDLQVINTTLCTLPQKLCNIKNLNRISEVKILLPNKLEMAEYAMEPNKIRKCIQSETSLKSSIKYVAGA